jgi:pre-60S factor REI1
MASKSCTLCGCSYKNTRKFLQHLESHGHIRNIADSNINIVPAPTTKNNFDVKGNGEDSSSDDDGNLSQWEGDFDSAECLFCNTESADLSESLEHMQKLHGLYIPDQEYLIDMESLLSYLHVIIFEFNECIYCGVRRGTAEGVQHHMKDRQHCRIHVEESGDLADFYEFPEENTPARRGDGEKGSHSLFILK